jgi:hypothetical protein
VLVTVDKSVLLCSGGRHVQFILDQAAWISHMHHISCNAYCIGNKKLRHMLLQCYHKNRSTASLLLLQTSRCLHTKSAAVRTISDERAAVVTHTLCVMLVSAAGACSQA